MERGKSNKKSKKAAFSSSSSSIEPSSSSSVEEGLGKKSVAKKPAPKKKVSEWSQSARRFCFTFNNYKDDDIDHLMALGKKDIRYIVFQPERAPSTNTPHLQGYAEFTKKITKKAACILLDPRAEEALKSRKIKAMKIMVFPCKGTRDQNIKYCTRVYEKDDPTTRKRDDDYPSDDEGFWENDFTSDVKKTKASNSKTKAPKDISIYGDAMEHLRDVAGPDEELEFYLAHPEITFKHLPNIRLLLQTFKSADGLAEAMKRLPENIRLPVWGRELLTTMCSCETPDRQIIWIWSKVGDVYKTFMAKYFMIYHDALLLDNGKSADIAFMYTGQPIVWFDFACSTESDDMKFINYHIIEKAKNGIVQSPKYQSMVKVFKCPWVIVTANFRIPRGKVKDDRLIIWKLDESSKIMEDMHDGLIDVPPVRLPPDEVSRWKSKGQKISTIFDDDSSIEESIPRKRRTASPLGGSD